MDIPLFRHTWRKELEKSSSPEVNLHFLIKEYLQDYGIPPETIPPDLDKLDSLLHELHRGHGGDLLKNHMVDIVRKEWGYPSPATDSQIAPSPQFNDDPDPNDIVKAKEAEELEESTYEDLLSLRHAWGKELREAAFPEDKFHSLMEDYLQDHGIPPRESPV